MPSVYTIEGSGGRRRRRKGKKRKGGGKRSAFGAAHKACSTAGFKPFTKSFGNCMRDKLGR